jgi:hypothetical protein
MRIAPKYIFFVILALTLHTSSILLFAADSALTVDQIIARHLDAVGTAAGRGAVKDRVVQGNAVYTILVGGGGSVSGTEGFVSEGNKLRLLIRFSAGDYKGENVAYNGTSSAVGFSNANQSRSPFSQLLVSQNIIVRDGLLGGVLSTAWPLLRSDSSKLNLVFDGSSKVDKRPAYRLRYQPGNSQDIQIMLYFDQETFRHLKSEYVAFVGTGMSSRGITMSSSLQPERTTLEEDFSDFQTFDGLNLPTTWKIHFTRERQSGSTTVSEWELKSNKIMHNVGLDPRNFEVK